MNKHSKYSIFIMIMNTAATTKATANNNNNMQSMLIIFEKTKKIYKKQQQVHNEKKKKIIIQLQKQINTQRKRKVKNMWKWINYKNPFEVNKKKNKIKCEIKKKYLKMFFIGGFFSIFV